MKKKKDCFRAKGTDIREVLQSNAENQSRVPYLMFPQKAMVVL